MIERKLDELISFLGSERTYVITEMEITRANRSLNLSLGNSSNMDDKLLCMLESQQRTLQYYEDFPAVDFTKHPDKWSVLQNFRSNSQGKLPDFAKKHNLDLNSLRRTVTVVQKEFAVEDELAEPGLSLFSSLFVPSSRK
jgi:hypothetical protein